MKFATALLAAAMTLTAGAAYANEAGPTTKTAKVAYSCQQGKKITVKYGFNKQNLPTYASAKIGNKTRTMPINLSRSNDVDTIFGRENSYSLSTSYTDFKNVRKNPMLITAPDNEIVFKDCFPAKAGKR